MEPQVAVRDGGGAVAARALRKGGVGTVMTMADGHVSSVLQGLKAEGIRSILFTTSGSQLSRQPRGGRWRSGRDSEVPCLDRSWASVRCRMQPVRSGPSVRLADGRWGLRFHAVDIETEEQVKTSMTSKAPSSRVLGSTSLLKPLAYKVSGSSTQRRSRRSWQSRTKESGSSASILRTPSSLSVTRRAYMDEAGPEPSRLCHYAVVHRSRRRADRHERLTRKTETSD